MLKILETAEKYVLFIVLALFAVFVFSGLTSPFTLPKEILLIVGGGLILILWIVRSIIKGSISFAIGKYDFAVILIALSFLASGIFKTPNKAEAFYFPGVVTFLIASAVFYFLINQLGKKVKEGALAALLISAVLLSVSILFAQLGIFAKIPQLPAFMKDPAFNPMGGILPSAIYLAVLVPVVVALVIKEKEAAKKAFFGVSGALIILGLGVAVYNLLPGKALSVKFPSFNTSWQVSVEALKESPLLGIGPGNYVTAFSLFRPIAYNASDLWQLRFTSATNFYFTLLTEVGLIGLAAFVILIFVVYKSAKSEIKNGDWGFVAIPALLIIFAILPSAPALIFLLMALLGIYSKSEEKIVSVSAGRVPTIVTIIPVLAGIVALVFFGTKIVLAESLFARSLTALTQNDAKKTFDLMSLASAKNPRVDRYHSSLAQLDMAFATSLASKKDLTEADRTTITQLIQSAINEGKAAVALNPGRSSSWEILGQIYRSIMPFAQGSDQFAIQTYTQAIALDPVNPNLRISLGGIYYALGNYDKAIETFKLAVLAKDDLANAHYNLAVAYREKKDYDSAITEMNSVLNIVKPGTEDYKVAKEVLDGIEKNKAVKTQESTGLTAPQKAVQAIKPPITLPTEATPPGTQ